MALTRFTQNMMAKFPSWMKMAKDPNSIGAQFLEVFGLSFQEFKNQLDEAVDNFYIETAHTDIIDILYRVPMNSSVVDDLEEVDQVSIENHDGSTTLVMESENLRLFYKRNVELPRFYIDRSSGYVYLRLDLDLYKNLDEPFKSVSINGAVHYEIEIHHVWNVFDEFALLLGLQRLPRERNEALKTRILDVFKNPGGLTNQGIKNGLARELGLQQEEVQVLSFHDQTFSSELIKEDGTPTKKMMGYAKQINDALKFTWDSMNFGEAYWFSLEQNNLGIHYLPHVWDVDTSVFQKEEFQSGIGFGDDLKVTAPVEQSSTRAFKAYVSLIGYYEQAEDIYPEIAFQYKIYAKGKKLEQTYEEQPFRYTVRAAETFNQSYRVIAKQEFPFTFRNEFFNRNLYEAGSERDKMQFGKSNDFLHTQTDPVMRLGIQMRTTSEKHSNRIPELDVVWEDTAGKEHRFEFQTEDDFLIDKVDNSGRPLTNTVYSDVSYDETDGLGLGYGAFQREYDTTLEWQQGSYTTDSILVRDGGVSLNLERMARLMN